MKKFIQEYGLAVLMVVVVISLIIIAKPISAKIDLAFPKLVGYLTESSEPALDKLSGSIDKAINVASGEKKKYVCVTEINQETGRRQGKVIYVSDAGEVMETEEVGGYTCYNPEVDTFVGDGTFSGNVDWSQAE